MADKTLENQDEIEFEVIGEGDLGLEMTFPEESLFSISSFSQLLLFSISFSISS